MITEIVLAVLTIAGAIALVGVVRAPSAAERMIALDLLLLVLAAGIAVWAVLEQRPAFLIVLVVVSLVAFVGTVVVARVIEAREEIQ
ncbi:MAG: monovalent cation/H+ antiporter complex subunit F [Acidimicrobiia bacterium]|nr:monovalent cation/H+ antiporter complex subunit F [Acidimicrobiia bacterium]